MKDNKKNIKKNNDKVEVVFILDRSGSMSGMEADTIGGFNSTLKKQREQGENVVWSTVLFDDKYEVIHNRVPIAEVKELTENEYYVRGCTALLDAVGKTIHHIAHVHKREGAWEAPGETLIVITTDGMENASREYTYKKVSSMIKKEQKKYGWEFLFLGANMDAVSEAGRIGISADRSGNLRKASASDLQKFLSQKRLSRQRISQILSGKTRVSRYDLMTLVFYNISMECDPDTKTEKRFNAFVSAVNEVLDRCYMGRLNIANPYESFLLMCMLTNGPLIAFGDVWDYSYENDQEDE